MKVLYEETVRKMHVVAYKEGDKEFVKISKGNVCNLPRPLASGEAVVQAKAIVYLFDNIE
ncbi:hypothetical protein KAR91_18015 [Candidatus Pacearchaeota archaeon]|nr:hypothetical protein [Candidatus Pacearchaeota archaeon]